jgi:hypothetical protein
MIISCFIVGGNSGESDESPGVPVASQKELLKKNEVTLGLIFCQEKWEPHISGWGQCAGKGGDILT